MKSVKFVLAILSPVLLLLLFLSNQEFSRTVSAAPTARPSAVAGGLCNRVLLPAILNGMAPIAMTELSEAGQLGEILPPPGQSGHAECDGFPDFNGDGYADLVIGAPRKGAFDTGIVQVVYGSSAGLNAGDGAMIDDQVWHRQLGGVAADADDLYGAAVAMGDFNSDGYDDLAVGIPGATINGQAGAGAVHVIFGSFDGLTNSGVQEWSLGANLIQGDPAAGDAFGTALAVGDFDNNGYDDLAIGIPNATVNGDATAGAVQILYGRPTGLYHLGQELLTQDTAGFAASPAEATDRFGFALAAGDFNGDGVSDLAVGTPYEHNGAVVDAGAVQIFFGQASAGIIPLVNPQNWRTDTPNVQGAMEANDRFGFSLAAGNFNGDAYDDLAVGSPFETHGEGAGALTAGGAINVFMGSATGLEATAANPARIWHQDSTGMVGDVGLDELFGYSLATGDFDNDGYDDLAIGVPRDRFFNVQVGGVHLMYGTASGLGASRNIWIYDSVAAASLDWFGAAVSVADFNGNGFADLAVGAFGDDPPGVAESNVGSVFTFYSDDSGVLQAEIQNWYPGYNGLKGNTQTNDYFGQALPGSPKR